MDFPASSQPVCSSPKLHGMCWPRVVWWQRRKRATCLACSDLGHPRKGSTIEEPGRPQARQEDRDLLVWFYVVTPPEWTGRALLPVCSLHSQYCDQDLYPCCRCVPLRTMAAADSTADDNLSASGCQGGNSHTKPCTQYCWPCVCQNYVLCSNKFAARQGGVVELTPTKLSAWVTVFIESV